MTCSTNKQDVTQYELSIEPITFVSIMGRYSHMLKVRYEGIPIDSGRVLYLSLTKELGVTDLTGSLTWYRGGATQCQINGVLVRTSMPFSIWVLHMLQQYRAHILHQDGKQRINFTWLVTPSSGSV